MGNYLEQKMISKTQLSSIKLESKAKIRITDDFNMLVKYLCDQINTIEWSGILFFQVTGDINDSEGIVITPVDIYPMDKGSSGYTEYDFSEKVFDYYDKYPERFGMKYGHIHSHHNMSSFFSGTDVQELIDNCVNHSYYASLIVNNRNEMVARLAIAGKKEVESKSSFSFSGILGNVINLKKDSKVEENVMYYIEMEIERESPAVLNEFFLNKVKELKDSPGVNPFVSFNPTVTSFKADTRNQYIQKEFDFEFEEREEELPINDILIKCIGGGRHDDIQMSFNNLLYSNGIEVSEEDLRFYLEQSFAQESIIEVTQEFQRKYWEEPSLDTLVKMYKKFKGILNMYRNSRYRKVVIISLDIIDSEINEINKILNEK